MAGRPPLRIGQHGKIRRVYLGGGVWMAECRYRDADGVTRKVQRLGPADEHDKYGKLAADALTEALQHRRAPASAEEIGLDTRLGVLVERHLTRLEGKGRSPATMNTYRVAAKKLERFLGGVRVEEATAGRINDAIDGMRLAHGATMARQARTILLGGMQLAVLAGVIPGNPVRQIETIERSTPRKGAVALSVEDLRSLLVALRGSDYCHEADLVDPITVLIATGLRRSELLALRWKDFSPKNSTLTVAGKVVRAAGVGLQRIEDTKSESGKRTVALPRFAVEALKARRARPYVGEHELIFASTTGGLRDPNNLGKQWRKVREDLGVPQASTHSFRKSVATMIDDEGLSARVGADQLGHANVSMTQNNYMRRGQTHTEVADLLERAINAE